MSAKPKVIGQYSIEKDGEAISVDSIIVDALKGFMDACIHKIHWKAFLVLCSGFFLKYLFIISLYVAYLNKGNSVVANYVLCLLLSYDTAQTTMLKKKYTYLAIVSVFAVSSAGYYIWHGGPAWHLIIMISALLLFELISQHGLSLSRDAETLTSVREKLTEEMVGKADNSTIRVRTMDGRSYTFSWDVEGIQKLLDDFEKEQSEDQEEE